MKNSLIQIWVKISKKTMAKFEIWFYQLGERWESFY